MSRNQLGLTLRGLLQPSNSLSTYNAQSMGELAYMIDPGLVLSARRDKKEGDGVSFLFVLRS